MNTKEQVIKVMNRLCTGSCFAIRICELAGTEEVSCQRCILDEEGTTHHDLEEHIKEL